MLNYRWTVRKYDDEETVHNLAKNLNIPKSLAHVLATRGLISKNDAEDFFKPELSNLHNPFIMEDMEKAVNRILEAVEKKELIWVHGDYDVDGTASTAMVYQFLTSIGGRVDYYIPDRFDDGYGLSNKSIDLAISKNAKILLTVDVGITSYEQLTYAKANGFDTIVCDHHEPGETLPQAYAILDPLMKGCPYPFKFLAACGVAFKLVQGISIQLGDESKAYDYLDYVAIASAADMVPLRGENRIMVYHGLKQLNKKPRPGLHGLLHCTGLRIGKITASNIVYAVAPLINAAGRLGDAKRSVEMMLQQDENASFRIAQVLEDENRKRRLLDQRAFEEAIPMAKYFIENNSPHSLVIYGEDWHAGVIGIVASRLVDKFNLPSVLLTNIDGIAKGSARSINNFDVHSALKKCDDLLLEYGGHKHAAGLSLKIENIDEFRRRFDELAHEAISKEMLAPEIVIDAELQFNELSPKFFHSLHRFAPFGFANYKPIFITKGVKSVNGIKVVGHNNIRFRAMHNNFVMDAIGQNLASKINICSNGKKFTMVYSLEYSNLHGSKNPQILIKDVRAEN